MATSRDQLIADWRERLAAAEEPQPADSQRAAWLARLRARLYRFLLSLYGSGDWKAPELIAERQRKQLNSVVIDAGALPLAGKPAKDESTIRATLESVAKAREIAAVQGPLAAGIDRDAWVIVASTRWLIDPQRCAAVLKANGIVSRLVSRSDDSTVEVRAYQELAAVDLIRSQLHRVLSHSLPVRPTPLSPEAAARAAENTSLINSVLAAVAIAGYTVFALLVGLIVCYLPMEVRGGQSVRNVEFSFPNNSLSSA